MGTKTGISWTDATWNPVTGCTRISEGCRHCYAERLAATRLKDTLRYKGLAVIDGGQPHWTSKIKLHPELLDWPQRKKKPLRIFVNSMSDLFHPGVPADFIAEVFRAMAACPQHTFQILTKRHDRMRKLLSIIQPEPLPNVWLGVSVEDQKNAEIRIPSLLETPAAVRFISAEPLLEPLDLTNLCVYGGQRLHALSKIYTSPSLDWIIVGGESGPHARPFKLEWARNLRDQCRGSGVPFFAKQLGSNPLDCDVPGAADPKEHMRYHTDHRSGADPAEWPDDLRVQEFPR